MTAGARPYLLKRTAYIKSGSCSAATLTRPLSALEAKEDYDSPEYQRIMMEDLYPKMICRLQPLARASRAHFGTQMTRSYNLMQGKSEFLVTGNLKDWERWERLREIKVKALTVGAQYDEMDPDDMKKMAALMQNASAAFCPNGSHFCMWDDQQMYFRQLLGFLRAL